MMNRKLSALALASALSLCVPMTSAALESRPTAASSNASPRVTGFNVDQVAQLAPGTDLRFTLWGTPGAIAAVQIDGASRPLVMFESRPGVYEGIYTISTRDQIKPDAHVDANLRLGSRVSSARLDEWLLTGERRGNENSAMPAPRIDSFELRAGPDTRSGKSIDFELRGTPGGRAMVRMVGAQSRFRLDERSPGDYFGTYWLQPSDRLQDKDPIVGVLRVNGRTVTTQVDDAVQLRQFSQRGDAPCSDCATVVSVNRIEVSGDGNYIGGTIAGGVLGAVLGNQVGGGRGRDLARVAGVLGGAWAGREVQKRNTDPEQHYEVVVEMRDSGERKVVTMEQQPDFKAGDGVQLKDGALTRLP